MPSFSRGRSNYEITKLRADRCLLFPGKGQITRLRDYELTDASFFPGEVKLRDYEITRLQAIIFGTFGI